MTSYSDTEATRDLGTGTGPVVREVPDPGYDDRPRAAAAGRDDRSIADLLRELRDESSTLLRQEVALAKTELSEKANVYTKNAGYVIGGGVAAALGGLLLLHFLAQLVGFVFDLFLPYSIGLPLGYLIVGSILAPRRLLALQEGHRRREARVARPAQDGRQPQAGQGGG